MKRVLENTKNYVLLVPLLAQDKINLKPGGSVKPLEGLTANSIIGGLIKLSLVAASLIFFFMLVIGGIKWILSGGDKAQTESARGQITAALVGLVVVFAAWAIAQLINTFFGFDIFNLEIPKLSP